jgi:uncharacterized protein (DUF433 family)
MEMGEHFDGVLKPRILKVLYSDSWDDGRPLARKAFGSYCVSILKRISIDPRVCFGRAVVRGTRIWVLLIVDNLAEGIPEAELLAAYPQLKPENIRAALAYAAQMTRERIIPIPMETVPA